MIGVQNQLSIGFSKALIHIKNLKVIISNLFSTLIILLNIESEQNT